MSAASERAHAGSRDILAIADLTPGSTHAVWRAARIARDQGAALRVLHAASDRASVASADETLQDLRGQLKARLDIDCDVQVVHGDMLSKAIEAAQPAGLLVIGPRRANPLREWMSGTQAERLVRLCGVPTLVVNRPAIPGRNAAPGSTSEPGRYARVLVCADLRPDAVDLITAAMSLSRDPQPQVLYALAAESDRRTRAAQAETNGRDTAMHRAQLALTDLIAAADAHEAGAVAAVAFGGIADCAVSRARAVGAELVVIGKRRRGPIADFFRRGSAGHVLERSESDVLLMPRAAAAMPAGAPQAALQGS